MGTLGPPGSVSGIARGCRVQKGSVNLRIFADNAFFPIILFLPPPAVGVCFSDPPEDVDHPDGLQEGINTP